MAETFGSVQPLMAEKACRAAQSSISKPVKTVDIMVDHKTARWTPSQAHLRDTPKYTPDLTS